MIIPGVVSATFRSKSAEEIIRLCREARLEAVEWSELAHVMPDDPEGAAALYEQTKAAGLQIAAYGSYYRLGQQADPEAVFRASAVSAVALHAPVIRLWAGTKPSVEVSEEERRALAEEMALVCGIAEEYGLRAALEWHRNTLTDTNESAMEFFRETDHKNMYSLWQPTVELSMEERTRGLDLLGNRLVNLHIYYWPDGVRRPLEEGVEAWKRYLSHVDWSEDHFGLLEFVMNDTEEQFLADAAVLHRLLGSGR